MRAIKPVLRIGMLAYWDSSRGLIPCRVTAIVNNPPLLPTATFTITANRPPYHYGESHTDHTLHVPPRGAVSHRKYGSRIHPFDVELPPTPSPRARAARNGA